MNISNIIEKALSPIRRRIQSIVRKALVDIVRDDKNLQVVQVLFGEDEIQDGLERLQEYGFTSVPEKGAEALVLSIAGNRSQGVVIKTDDHRYRPKNLQSGDVALYRKEGHMVILKAGGFIEIGKENLKQLITEEILPVLIAHIHDPSSGVAIYVPPLSTLLHATQKTRVE